MQQRAPKREVGPRLTTALIRDAPHPAQLQRLVCGGMAQGSDALHMPGVGHPAKLQPLRSLKRR